MSGRSSESAAHRRAVKANRLPLFIGIGVLVLAVIVCGLLLFRTTDTSAAVQSAQWQRAIEIMEMRPVDHETWRDQIPSGAALGSCELKVRATQDQPAPNAEKICGTPYTIDTGSGVGKVVQDCQYEVKDDWCTYMQQEWTVVDSIVAKGADANPQWPAMNLRGSTRERSARILSGDLRFGRQRVSVAGSECQ